jgi:2-polyprenyl-6-methoxyphenol hydroxylase-like FAD-dependent oxidoreductase
MTSRADRAERWARLERDVAQEKAAALGRAGERLESALAEAAALARALAEARGPGERERLAADYEAARQRALAARLALVVQREAIGLRQHRILDQHFPEPPRLGID